MPVRRTIAALRVLSLGACVLSGACALLGACLLLEACGGDPADLSVEQLSKVVDERRPTLKACYDAALERQPYKQELTMNAVIHIEKSGKVLEVEFDDTGLPGMPACLREAILAWRFPEAEADTHTSLPIVFKPEIVKKAPELIPLEPGDLEGSN